MDLINKKISIIGCGKSGYETAMFLRKQGADVFITDGKENAVVNERVHELVQYGVICETGQHSLNKIVEADYVVISPGISPKTDLYREPLA